MLTIVAWGLLVGLEGTIRIWFADVARLSQGPSISYRKSVKREKGSLSSLLHSLYLHFQLGMVKEADSPPTTQTISEAIMEKEEVNQSTSQSQKSQAVMEWLLGNYFYY